MRRFIVITGPTASGKTRVSVETAKMLRSRIISADSMQIYKNMDIGTAKATAEEMKGVRHEMIDIVSPDEEYSVAEYQKTAFDLIEKSNANGEVPVIVGGTGLYINSLVYALDFGTRRGDAAFRQKMTQLADDKSLEYLYNELENKDPEYAKIIARTDKRRIIRRLELIQCGGAGTYDFRRPNVTDDYVIIGLTMPRQLLYDRINARVDEMISKGLVDEVWKIYQRYGDVNALKAIGYKELVAYFKNETTLDEAISLIKRNTRRYAKRQLTWFARDERIKWFDVSNGIEDTIYDIMFYIKGKGF